MAHDVFISYAAEDVTIGNAVCSALEGNGIKCWIAPRDVPYGADYEEAIIDAISASPILVLVLSTHSNASPHVKREIQNACSEGSPTYIIPLRTDNIQYSKPLRYYLSSTQWLDATTPPLEQHLQRLIEHVRARLPRQGTTPAEVTKTETLTGATVATGMGGGVQRTTGDTRVDQTAGTRGSEKRRPLTWLVLAGGALVLILVVAVIPRLGSRDGKNKNQVNENESAANLASPPPTQQPTRSTPVASPVATIQPTPRPPRNLNIRVPANIRVTDVFPTRPDDNRIKQHIEKRMASHGELSGVDVEVKDGIVTLSGTVPTADWKSTAQMLSKIEGVKRVVNKIQ